MWGLSHLPLWEGGTEVMLAWRRVLQKEQSSFSRPLEIPASYLCKIHLKHTNLNFRHKSHFQNLQCYIDVSAGNVLNMSSL